MGVAWDPGLSPDRVDVYRLRPGQKYPGTGAIKQTHELAAVAVPCLIDEPSAESVPDLAVVGQSINACVWFDDDPGVDQNDLLLVYREDGRPTTIDAAGRVDGRVIRVVRQRRDALGDIKLYRVDGQSRE